MRWSGKVQPTMTPFVSAPPRTPTSLIPIAFSPNACYPSPNLTPAHPGYIAACPGRSPTLRPTGEDRDACTPHPAPDRLQRRRPLALGAARRQRPLSDFYSPIRLPAAQLTELGDWIGLHVFGDLRTRLAQVCRPPATPVTVIVPAQASGLLLRPLELARLADGRSLADAGIRFVYSAEPPPNLPRRGGGAVRGQARSQPLPQFGGGREGVRREGVPELRLLAVFTLPDATNPLNLRRERHNLHKLVQLAQGQGKAVTLRVLQYGATRASLRAALEEAPGWDVVQISGHGLQGELVLEDARGGADRIGAGELADLLELGQERLQLLILNACYSGAASHTAARARIGLDSPTTRQAEADGPEVAGAESAPAREDANEQVRVTLLPSLGQQLAERLGCAALAMRYPVGDAFAADLMGSLYDKLLDKGRPLPGALHLALAEILAGQSSAYPALSPATPILLGRAAEELHLTLPSRGFQMGGLPTTSLGIAFPAESERFVGRLGPMRRASQALAPANPQRGVLFYGMPGAGKTACALELAHRHAEGRFVGYVWFKWPEMGMDVSRALYDFLFEMERQLDMPSLALTANLDNPAFFRQRTLPRLGAVLEQNALLLVLDNLENLLTSSDGWQDPLWGDTLTALLAQRGASRVDSDQPPPARGPGRTSGLAAGGHPRPQLCRECAAGPGTAQPGQTLCQPPPPASVAAHPAHCPGPPQTAGTGRRSGRGCVRPGRAGGGSRAGSGSRASRAGQPTGHLLCAGAWAARGRGGGRKPPGGGRLCGGPARLDRGRGSKTLPGRGAAPALPLPPGRARPP